MTIEKYGQANDIDFGTDGKGAGASLTIVTSYSVEETYSTELFLKDSTQVLQQD